MCEGGWRRETELLLSLRPCHQTKDPEKCVEMREASTLSAVTEQSTVISVVPSLSCSPPLQLCWLLAAQPWPFKCNEILRHCQHSGLLETAESGAITPDSTVIDLCFLPPGTGPLPGRVSWLVEEDRLTNFKLQFSKPGGISVQIQFVIAAKSVIL